MTEWATNHLRPADAPPLQLMIPGPCQLGPREREVLARPVEPHYGPAWSATYHRLRSDLCALLGAERSYVLPGSGTTALDATMFNLFSPGERVAVVGSGYFGSRLATQAESRGLEACIIPCAPDRPVELDAVRARIPGCQGLLVTHVETSTAIRQPVAALASIARDEGALILVDGIASAAGEQVDLAAMDIDAFVAASQKGLAAAPGLGIVALGRRGLNRLGRRPRAVRPWCLDLVVWDDEAAGSPEWEPHPVTMPTNLVNVLASSVARIRDTGPETWIKARRNLARHCRAGLRDLGLSLAAPEDSAANLVVVVAHPRADDIRQELLRRSGILVAKGLWPLDDGVFRVGLIGCTAVPSMVDLLLHELATLV
jgi:alanine-glyoxylate transaminase/serine-glyoxylate transaminase/serine-pyruvate transaminase